MNVKHLLNLAVKNSRRKNGGLSLAETDGRGVPSVKIERCSLCGDCGERCISGAIRVRSGRREWVLDELKCIRCGWCEEICPERCIELKKGDHSPSEQKVREQKTKKSAGSKDK